MRRAIIFQRRGEGRRSAIDGVGRVWLYRYLSGDGDKAANITKRIFARRSTVDVEKETKQLQADLLQSVKDMKRNTVKTKSGRTLIVPSDEEEAAINRGIAADPDNPEWTAEDFARARPFSELIKEKGIGQPPRESPQEEITIEYDADVLKAFRATGEGWQTRMNYALRTYLKEHPL